MNYQNFKNRFPATYFSEGYCVLLYAQAVLESGNFQSKLATDYNNVFGMGYPTVRPAVNTGYVELTDNVGGYTMKFSKYDSITQSIEDRILWDIDRGFLSPTGLVTLGNSAGWLSLRADTNNPVWFDYIVAVAENYATDSNYIQAWQDVITSVASDSESFSFEKNSDFDGGGGDDETSQNGQGTGVFGLFGLGSLASLLLLLVLGFLLWKKRR